MSYKVTLKIISSIYYFQRTERNQISKHHLQKAQEFSLRNAGEHYSDQTYQNFTITSVAAVAGIKINTKLQNMNFSSSRIAAQGLKAFEYVKDNLRGDLKMKVSPWSLAAGWVKAGEIHAENTPELGYVLNAMLTYKIVHAGVGYKGTQLKMMIQLSGGQEIIFKPKK